MNANAAPAAQLTVKAILLSIILTVTVATAIPSLLLVGICFCLYKAGTPRRAS